MRESRGLFFRSDRRRCRVGGKQLTPSVNARRKNEAKWGKEQEKKQSFLLQKGDCSHQEARPDKNRARAKRLSPIKIRDRIDNRVPSVPPCPPAATPLFYPNIPPQPRTEGENRRGGEESG